MVEKNETNAPYDPNADLISSLLSATSNRLQRVAVSAQEALGGGLSRAMRLIEPPPKGEGREKRFIHFGAIDPLWIPCR